VWSHLGHCCLPFFTSAPEKESFIFAAVHIMLVCIYLPPAGISCCVIFWASLSLSLVLIQEEEFLIYSTLLNLIHIVLCIVCESLYIYALYLFTIFGRRKSSLIKIKENIENVVELFHFNLPVLVPGVPSLWSK
jgi:hypothetical protein